MKSKNFVSLLLMVLLSVVAACHRDGNQTKLQWMPDMADSPTVKAQESFIDPPDHAVSTQAILYPATAEESEKLLQNPYPASADMVAKGKEMYDTYCTVCHGADAKGGGQITDLFPRPPDITMDLYAKRADGFFFHRITFGGVAMMPAYGYAITPAERWQIVHYLRTLQKKGG